MVDMGLRDTKKLVWAGLGIVFLACGVLLYGRIAVLSDDQKDVILSVLHLPPTEGVDGVGAVVLFSDGGFPHLMVRIRMKTEQLDEMIAGSWMANHAGGEGDYGGQFAIRTPKKLAKWFDVDSPVSCAERYVLEEDSGWDLHPRVAYDIAIGVHRTGGTADLYCVARIERAVDAAADKAVGVLVEEGSHVKTAWFMRGDNVFAARWGSFCE